MKPCNLFTLIFVLYSPMSLCYYPSIHYTLSEKACKLTNIMILFSSQRFYRLNIFTPDQITHIAKQNAKQDTGIEQALLRPMNYHFYNKDKELVQAYKPTSILEKIVTNVSSWLAKMAGP